MGRDRAAYMREYRVRKAILRGVGPKQTIEDALVAARKVASDCAEDYAALLEEVRHLKAELAKRPNPTTAYYDTLKKRAFNTQPFTPVPKRK